MSDKCLEITTKFGDLTESTEYAPLSISTPRDHRIRNWLLHEIITANSWNTFVKSINTRRRGANWIKGSFRERTSSLEKEEAEMSSSWCPLQCAARRDG